MPDDRPVLTIGHSPDPDDAFMWWPLGDETPGVDRAPSIDTGRFRFRAVPLDIEALNRRAIEHADLDVTAMSANAYPFAKGRYAVTSCGASMGDGYGPKVVARGSRPVGWLSEPGVVIAIPGERTSAFLALRLLAGSDLECVAMPFDTIIDAVLDAPEGSPPHAGLVIHEGQLTFADEGLTQVVDLGAWWKERTGLPLPLGLNTVRRDLDERFGDGAAGELCATLARSIRHALADRPRGLGVALQFSRGVTAEQVDRFVGMYVDDLTLDMAETGAQALRALLGEGHSRGLCPDPGSIDIVRPG